jgi:hypothetical protein
LTNDAAANQTYWGSLPPKEKTQILDTNAAAHQKHWESLPLEKKAQILETHATTQQQKRHQHLTEEEQKIAIQIK